jgi:hypothetical protein
MASHDFRDYNERVCASAKADCQLLTAESLRQCFGCGYARAMIEFDKKKDATPAVVTARV